MPEEQVAGSRATGGSLPGAAVHTPSSAPVPGAAPTQYRIRAQSRAGGEASAEAAQVTVPFDASWGSAPRGLPGPAELLASAFAACLLKNLARSGSLMRFEYADAEVEVIARRQDTPPKFIEIAYTLHITTDEPARRVKLMHLNLSKFGTVYNTLAAVCDVHGEVVTTPCSQPVGEPASRRSDRERLAQPATQPPPHAPARKLGGQVRMSAWVHLAIKFDDQPVSLSLWAILKTR